MDRIVIIGNGVAGVTAARYIRKREAASASPEALEGSTHRKGKRSITLISAESKYFFSRTALMYIYMGHMRLKETQPYEEGFWEKNDIRLVQDYVQRVDTAAKSLHLASGKTVLYDTLIIASGSRYNRFGWPGQDLDGVGGLVSLQDLEYLETYSHDTDMAVVVGGGLIGIELCEMLHSRGIHVHFLVREKSYWNKVLPPEESAMVNREIERHGITLHLGTGLKEILPDENGRVKGIVTDEGKEIPCRFVGLCAGVRPNIEFLEGSGIETNRGILVDEFLRTSAPDVYALGDCAEIREPRPGRSPIEAVWYTGKMMGETAARNICGEQVSYDPGIWFNSAKFFDIEYQIYGEVPTHIPDDGESLYWEHPGGRKAIRIFYGRTDGAVKGFHLMGIRYRHRVCEDWIARGAHIEEVLRDLSAANFDPEFFDRHEKELVKLYESQSGKKVAMKSRNSLLNLIFPKTGA